jgi:hypothetical protein
VRRLLDRAQKAGAGSSTWDCRDDAGREVPKGTYFVRLDAHGTTRARKFILLE